MRGAAACVDGEPVQFHQGARGPLPEAQEHPRACGLRPRDGSRSRSRAVLRALEAAARGHRTKADWALDVAGLMRWAT